LHYSANIQGIVYQCIKSRPNILAMQCGIKSGPYPPRDTRFQDHWRNFYQTRYETALMVSSNHSVGCRPKSYSSK